LHYRDDSRGFNDKRKRDFTQTSRILPKAVSDYAPLESNSINGTKEVKLQSRGFNDDESVVLRVDGDFKVENSINMNVSIRIDFR
jgi:hypothetical protein